MKYPLFHYSHYKQLAGMRWTFAVAFLFANHIPSGFIQAVKIELTHTHRVTEPCVQTDVSHLKIN